MEQLVLPGLALSSRTAGGVEPLYFAIYPQAAAADEAWRLAWRLRGGYGLRGSPIGRSKLHLSLQGLGDGAVASNAFVELACRAAARVQAPAFRVAFNQAASYGGPGNHPLVLAEGDGTVGVDRLRASVRTALAAEGVFLEGNRAFSPHVTLLYDERPIAPVAIEPVSWVVREFFLVRSVPGTGRRVRLGCWPLEG
jgi:2'-5' RNA ligase